MALCSGHIERIHRYVTGGYPRVNTRPEASPFEELRFFDLKRVVHSRLGGLVYREGSSRGPCTLVELRPRDDGTSEWRGLRLEGEEFENYWKRKFVTRFEVIRELCLLITISHLVYIWNNYVSKKRLSIYSSTIISSCPFHNYKNWFVSQRVTRHSQDWWGEKIRTKRKKDW